ncbi:hypothetical protein AC578_628 [Pseudocercospora eumusae]|uniref:Uncharacterized protein n=1 Tax=Pseudocercospora eumusae TaxID=321146 RepID=A0A139HFF8_9PEZI|nr:hypothetical protein AC578_628 [Pseudocercospora eumusae]
MLFNTAIILGLAGAVLARPAGLKRSNNIVEVRAPTAAVASADYIYTQHKREAEADAKVADTDYIYTREADVDHGDYIYTRDSQTKREADVDNDDYIYKQG